MTEPRSFVVDLALVLCMAAATSVLFRKLRQPAVLGYLLAGLIVGPHIPIPLFADVERVRLLSELGVVLLMFFIGLEFSLRKLVRQGMTAVLVGLFEVSAMIWLGYLAGRALGWSTLESFFAGAMVAISSTTIIAKALAERPVEGRLRDLVFGVLIVEDLVAILLLAIAPTLSPGGDLPAGDLALSAARLIGVLIAVVVGGFLLVPAAIRFVARLGSLETLLVASVGVCFGLVLVAGELGYSAALGAFLAGSLIAESGQGEAVERLVGPLRDVFAAVFFVSVGMLFDPRAFVEHWPAVLALTVVVVVGKAVSVATGAALLGVEPRSAVRAGMCMGQNGEFSFLIAAAAIGAGLAAPFLTPVAIAVSVITTFTTPWLIAASARTAGWLERKLPHRLQAFLGLYGSWLERLRGRRDDGPRSPARRAVRATLIDVGAVSAIVIAASSVGEELVGQLGVLGVPRPLGQLTVVIGTLLLAAPFVVGLFRSTRVLGRELATRAFPVPSGRADTAAAPRHALLMAIRLATVLVVGAVLLALTQPFVPAPYGALVVFVVLAVVGIAFYRSTRELHLHLRACAQVVLEVLSKKGASSREDLDAVESLLPGFGHVTPLRLGESDPGVGKTLRELDLRSRTGATVVAIGGRPAGIVAPTGHEALRAGDVLAIVGPDAAVDAARGLLLRDP